METSAKIGIITLSASDNCGSLLQAYALKRLLQSYGNVEVINFSSEHSHKLYDLPQINLKKKISFLFYSRNKKKYTKIMQGKQSYEQFRRDYIEMDSTELFSEDLKFIKDKYDVVVAGSDQIWNIQMFDFDKAFFCGWTSKKKVAYAPSLGNGDIGSSPYTKQFIQWLNEFDYLSVREEIGKKHLNNFCSKNITRVLDPTLLLGETEWKKLVGEPLIKGRYIFYYSWAYCYEDEKKIVKNEGEKLNLPVIVFDARKWMTQDERKYGFVLSEDEGPLAFLNLIYYAEICFVESFHGMVFSYIFRKNFWLLDIYEDLTDLDDRLMEFVDLLGAEDRVLTKFNYGRKDIQKQMDYSNNKKLKNLQDASQMYLEEAFRYI